jgi:hypothetical protein
MAPVSHWGRRPFEESMQTKMIADMKFTYAGRALKPGDPFEASDNDAFALRTYQRAHLANEDDVEPKSGSRRYRRRDMQADQQ